MKIQEADAKQLLRAQGLPVPPGTVARSVSEATTAAAVPQEHEASIWSLRPAHGCSGGRLRALRAPGATADAPRVSLSRAF